MHAYNRCKPLKHITIIYRDQKYVCSENDIHDLFSFAIFCIGLKVSSKIIFSMYLCSPNEYTMVLNKLKALIKDTHSMSMNLKVKFNETTK